MSWLRRIGILSALLLLFAGSLPTRSQAQPDVQQTFLSFQYKGVVDTLITGMTRGENVYLPISQIFDQLGINNTVDLGANRVSGFYLNPERNYVIEVNDQSAEVGSESWSFDADQAIVGTGDIYLAPELYEQWFGLSFSVDYRDLSMSLSTDHRMPRVQLAELGRQREAAQYAGGQGTRPPIRFPRERHWINGGVLDYSLTAVERTHDRNSLSYSIRQGIELLGGDLEGGISGKWEPNEHVLNPRLVRWRWGFPTNPYVTRIRVGESFSEGQQLITYRGLKVSNEPLDTRETFTTFHLEERTGPHWEVELYLDGNLVAVTQADASGNYSFDIPLRYGTTIIELRAYGPQGGRTTERRHIRMPFSLLPPGEVEYDIHTGQRASTGELMSQARAGVGLTSYLTAEAGMEYFSRALPMPHPYGTLTARLGDHYVASATTFPDVLHRVTIGGFFPSQARFQITGTQFMGRSLYNLGRATSNLSSQGYVPIDLGLMRLSAQWSMQMFQLGNRTDGQIFPQLTFSLPFGSATFSYRYRTILLPNENVPIVQDAGLRLFHRIAPRPSIPGIFHNVSLSPRVLFDLKRDALRSVELNATRSITEDIQLGIDLKHDFIIDQFMAGIRLDFNFPWTRAATSFERRGPELASVQRLRGSVGYDHTHNKVVFHNRQWVGQSATSFRFFADRNGNRTFDEGEQVVKSDVFFRRAVSTRQGSENIVRAHNLQPYAVHSVDLTRGAPEDPKWVPYITSFSLRTDPNTYKPVDVPLFVGGTIEGEVQRETATGLHPAEGMVVHLTNADSTIQKRVRVFRDGRFYDYQLPPGNYTLHVDSTQMAQLGLQSDPPVRTFELQPSPRGDQVSNLDFILRDPAEVTKEGLPQDPGPQTGYIIQLASFQSHSEARRYASTVINTDQFVDMSQQYVSRALQIHYHSDVNQYVVQVDTLRKRWKAADILTRLQSDPRFTNAFLIESPPGTEAAPSTYEYALQAGTFRQKESAEQFITELKQQIVIPIDAYAVKDAKLDQFRVLLSPSADKQEVQRLRNWLHNQAGLVETYIVALNPDQQSLVAQQ